MSDNAKNTENTQFNKLIQNRTKASVDIFIECIFVALLWFILRCSGTWAAPQHQAHTWLLLVKGLQSSLLAQTSGLSVCS
jgi:hypothetical protein